MRLWITDFLKALGETILDMLDAFLNIPVFVYALIAFLTLLVTCFVNWGPTL